MAQKLALFWNFRVKVGEKRQITPYTRYVNVYYLLSSWFSIVHYYACVGSSLYVFNMHFARSRNSVIKINSAYLVRHFFCLFYLYVISCTFITLKIRLIYTLFYTLFFASCVHICTYFYTLFNAFFSLE